MTVAPVNGFLRPCDFVVTIVYNGVDYEVKIKQIVVRTISIFATNGNEKDSLTLYYSIIELLMLIEGQFFDIVNANYNNTGITESFLKRELTSYHTSNHLKGTTNILFEFEKVLNVQLILNWIDIRTKLDLIHKMALYCFSDVSIPCDIKCSFTVELFEGLAELVKEKKHIVFEKAKRGESQLVKNLIKFIDNYGKEIFKEEIAIDEQLFCEILVETRNRIAHIRTKNNKQFLDGAENLCYNSKLFLLYRVVIFELLDIQKSTYEKKLVEKVSKIDSSDDVKTFLKKLQNNNP